MSSLRICRLAAVVVLALGLVFVPVTVHATPWNQHSTSLSVEDSGDVFSWMVSTLQSFFGFVRAEPPDRTDSRSSDPESDTADLGPAIDIAGEK
jgi:hypothetical protein